MSSRALRRLKGNPRGQEALQAGDPELETGEEEEETQTEPAKNTSRKAKKNKKQKNICNIYELDAVCGRADADGETEPPAPSPPWAETQEEGPDKGDDPGRGALTR
ncbi:UNVERIFIED_CONTAM: hypothetical protein FKN15_043715 [Acipenser sinensis]